MRPRADAPPLSYLARVLLVSTAAVVVVAATGPSGVRADAPAPTSDDLTAVGCPDPLVVHRPDGSVGATAAVAITSQALARDEPGWTSVGWQAAPGTQLTTIVVTTPSRVQRQPGEPSGTARGVLELAFCGTHDPGAAAGGHGDRGEPATARTASVRFAEPSEAATGTLPASVFGAALGLAAGAVVLLMSRSARRDREATR